jgi:hypothetical protein
MFSPDRIKPLLKPILTPIIALAIGASAIAVLACGPDFPLQLLDNRAGTLKGTPTNSFAFEVMHLIPVSDRLITNETGYDPFEAGTIARPNAGPARDVALTAAQLAQIKAMRETGDGDAAYALGEGLPMALRLYTAGAVDYLASMPKTDSPAPKAPAATISAARAQSRFQAVLALPAADSDIRSVWAAYMLGQGYASAMQTANADMNARRADAIRSYTLARARANGGALDSQGLAVASFGEQARLYLARGAMLCSYLDFANATPCADGIASNDLKQAIHLYVEQAAHGSTSGLASLHYIANWLLSDDARVAKTIDDPLVQRLLVAFALARVGDIAPDDPASGSYFGPDQSTGRTGYNDVARGAQGVKPNRMLQSLVAALQKRGIDHAADADRLAALAYRVGRYDLAQALIDKQSSALSSWVRAKLALRRGDMAGAANAYAEAAKAFPQTDASLEPASAALLKAEQGVLTLSRGQYVEALDQLYTAAASVDTDSTKRSVYGDYTGDAFYVAERVITTDELKNYVDAHVPATSAAMSIDFAAMTAEQRENWVRQHPKNLADRLRQLLARRLVREERVTEALPYFPDDNDPRYIERRTDENGKTTFVAWRMRQSAREYGAALDDAHHAWRSVTRAQAWYKAATLARQRGMEIMGYEQAPDFAEFGGMLSFGMGRGTIVSGISQGYIALNKAPVVADTPQARAIAEVPGPFVTDEERKRYAASESVPNRRYHYRALAADDIMLSADLLPARSQAFAAVLCQGAGFIINDDGVDKLYRRYVKQGALVPFAKDFGTACAEPDFHAAAWFPYVQAWHATHRWAHSHRRDVLGLIALLLALIASAVLWRTRRRKDSNNTSI